MIIYHDIHFHNCTELVADNLRQGLRIQRIPESVRSELHPFTQRSILSCNGVELRFRMPEGWVNNEIILSSLHKSYAYVFHGDFKQAPVFRYEIGPAPSVVSIFKPERLGGLPGRKAQRHQFDPGLIRVVLAGEAGPVFFHGSTLPVEAPCKEDVPEKVLLAYGTSITAGHHADIPSLQSFAALTARAMKWDHLNLGCAGSAFLDKAMADHLATRKFDFATLCLSVNMVASYSVEEFNRRASYLVNKLHRARPDARIACISILPYFNDWSEQMQEKVKSYRAILKRIVEDIDHPNVGYLHGPDLLKDLSGLTADLIHPNNEGFAEIASNIVRYFQSI